MESSFIILNGEQHLIQAEQSVLDLLSSLGLGGRPVVVELNEQAILPSLFVTSILASGDRVEIVSIVAGG